MMLMLMLKLMLMPTPTPDTDVDTEVDDIVGDVDDGVFEEESNIQASSKMSNQQVLNKK